MRLNRTSAISEIKLAENKGVPKELQFLRVGKFNHPKYGKFEITPQVLSEMKSNFDARVRGIDTAFDYFHDSDKEAAAWVNEMELREDGTELWAKVDWTPVAEKKLAERELRYFSPDFTFKWEDPESGTVHSNVIFGGGLTNRPFVKEMKAIVADEKQTGVIDMTELEKAQKEITDLKAQNVKLSEDKGTLEKQMADMPKPDKVAALEQQITALQAELAKAKAEAETALAEKVKADEAAKLAEKTSEFNVLLSEGKACAAQKDAFMKGDMKEFIKLSEKPNLKPAGSSTSETGIVAGSREEKVIKLAEEKVKADPKLNIGDAMSMANKEVPKDA